MENVPGLVRLFGGRVKEEVLSDFSAIGYKVKVQQLSSDDYGVPQQRKRVFFVGINEYKTSKLNCCVYDAKSVKELLESHYDGTKNFHSKILLDNDATRAGIRRGIRDYWASKCKFK